MDRDGTLIANVDLIREEQQRLQARQSILELRQRALEEQSIETTNELARVRAEQEEIRKQLSAFSESMKGVMEP